MRTMMFGEHVIGCYEECDIAPCRASAAIVELELSEVGVVL